MATETRDTRPPEDAPAPRPKARTDVYNEAVLGFKNYWYPIFSSRSVGRKPVGITIMKEMIVMMRTVGGEIKALANECAHRGTLLSIGAGLMPWPFWRRDAIRSALPTWPGG